MLSTVLEDVVSTAKRAVETFHDRSNGGLDFSEDGLSIVEEMLAEASDYVSEMAPSQVSELVRLLGCYVLEVARVKTTKTANVNKCREQASPSRYRRVTFTLANSFLSLLMRYHKPM